MSQVRPMSPQGGEQDGVRPVPPMPEPGATPSSSAAAFPGIDPNNPVAAYILSGMDRLSPQDISVLAQGITPPIAAVLSKILPEVEAVWSVFAGDTEASAINAGGGAPAPGGPGGGMPPAGGPAMPPGGDGMARPTTGLANITPPRRMA